MRKISAWEISYHVVLVYTQTHTLYTMNITVAFNIQKLFEREREF